MRISVAGAIGLALILVSVSVGATGQCVSCGTDSWSSQPPFESGQRYLNPYTLGLVAGVQAPLIDDLSYSAGSSLVVVINRSINPDYIPLIASWAEATGLQVAIVATSVASSTRAAIEQALSGTSARLITEPEAIGLSACFFVGERYSPVTFLVDKSGMIAFRRRGFANYRALELDRIVRAFAATGEIPEDSIAQHVLWYDDVAPWPDFPVETMEGEAIFVSEGVPRLLYSGFATGSGEVAFRDLTQLAKAYPEIEFVWLERIISEDGAREIWEYAHRFDLVDDHPEVFDVPLEEFLVAHDVEVRRAEFVQSAAPAAEDGWTILLDIDGKLARYWTLCVLPSVIILDGDGTVFFPCTQFPINLISGDPVVHPQAIPELTRILDDMLGR